MKLISMHVDNFGGLHNYDYNFADGLNVVLQDNGWGKTTMATFLKAMLYGYDTKRSKDITENDRKRYLPWQGGKYGGSLDFEAEGVHYRIFRTFGETPRFDTVRIVNLDTNTTARISPDKIGESLFHLDSNAFQRSVFINQNGLSIDGAASSIHTRLNALVSQANDVAAYDGAIDKLTQQIKVYEKTGARGQLGQITKQITVLERQRDQLDRDISEQDIARDRISEIDYLLNQLNTNLAEKNKKLDEITGEGKKQEAAKKIIEDINIQIQAVQKRMAEILNELGGEIPKSTDIDSAKRNSELISTLEEMIDALGKTQIKLEEEYNAILEKYDGKLPAASDLDDIQNIYGELQGIISSGTVMNRTEDIPDDYQLIKDILIRNPSYIEQLERVIDSQDEIQNLIRNLDRQNKEIKHEKDNWEDKSQRYIQRSKETDNLQQEIKLLAKYDPSVLDPTIEILSGLQKSLRLLTQKKAQQEQQIQKEESDWTEKRKQYWAMKKDVSELQEQTSQKSSYQSDKVQPVINKLEELQKLQQSIEMKKDAFESMKLTKEQEEVLKNSSIELPNMQEGNEILQKYRSLKKKEAEIEGLYSRLDGENSKLDSINSSLNQLETLIPNDLMPIEKPDKSSGSIMIGIGAIGILVGAVLGITVKPVLAAIAVIGLILVVLGISNNNNYKKQEQAYNEYQKVAAQYTENSKRKTELQRQKSETETTVASLNQQINALAQEKASEERAVSSWIETWNIGETTLSESTITGIMNHAELVKKLRAKEAEFKETEVYIEQQNNILINERKKIEYIYPECTGKTNREALKILRSEETDYIVNMEKLQSSTLRLERFLKEAQIEENQFVSEESPGIDELRKELEDYKTAITDNDKKRTEINEAYPEISGKSYDEALAFLRSNASTFKVSKTKLENAQQNETRFVNTSGYTKDELMSEESPKLQDMIVERDKTSSLLAEKMEQANDFLEPLGLDTDKAYVIKAIREAEGILNEYEKYAEKLKDQEIRDIQKEQQIFTLSQKLTDKTALIANCHEELEVPDRLALIREEIGKANQINSKILENNTECNRQKQRLEAAKEIVESFIKRHACFEGDDLLTGIFERYEEYSRLNASKRQFEKQRESVDLQNAISSEKGNLEEEEALRNEIGALKTQRDNLLIEYTQKSDFIRNADKSLEKYPDLKQEIHELYDQKQKAQNKLAILKKTIQLITKAKENLANRYLSKVENLFNSYMQIWLNNDAVKGMLDIDFNITIEENKKTHVAEGYSTGYADMIDFCMRLALVDTLFENEQPFLILDDPFVNLDEERLEKALELLNVMSSSKQIVYFVCHPIRAVETDENAETKAELMRLAEETRKTINEQKTNVTARKKVVRKSPKELYRVADPDAVIPFAPAKPNYIITNNIFSMNFVMNDMGVPKDKAYELFFIDAKGHILNERQIIEIQNGKLSSERIRFSLNTRDDSGDEYELMIHESGRDDYEVIARLPFTAKLSFASFDF